MDASVWYRSPVFVGALVSVLCQILALIGFGGIATEDVAKAVDGILQLVAIAAGAYAVWKRKQSTVQPLTLTQKGADNHPNTIANAAPVLPPPPPPSISSHWLIGAFLLVALLLSQVACATDVTLTWEQPECHYIDTGLPAPTTPGEVFTYEVWGGRVGELPRLLETTDKRSSTRAGISTAKHQWYIVAVYRQATWMDVNRGPPSDSVTFDNTSAPPPVEPPPIDDATRPRAPGVVKNLKVEKTS